VRPEGLGKFKNSPHQVSNPQPSGLRSVYKMKSLHMLGRYDSLQAIISIFHLCVHRLRPILLRHRGSYTRYLDLSHVCSERYDVSTTQLCEWNAVSHATFISCHVGYSVTTYLINSYLLTSRLRHTRSKSACLTRYQDNFTISFLLVTLCFSYGESFTGERREKKRVSLEKFLDTE
jgi:hypothetical protein